MFLASTALLLVTAWAVSGTAPGAERSVWPAILTVVGLLYALPVPLAIALPDQDDLKSYSVTALLTLVPGAIVIGLAIWGFSASAYAHLGRWCAWTFAAMLVAVALGALHRRVRAPPAPDR